MRAIHTHVLPRDAMLARYIYICCRRVSVCHKPVLYRNDWTNRASFWHGGFLPSIPHCYKEIWASPEIKVLSPGTLSQIPDFETISPRQLDRIVNKSRRRSSLLTQIGQSWLFTTILSTVTLYNSYTAIVVDLLYNLFV